MTRVRNILFAAGIVLLILQDVFSSVVPGPAQQQLRRRDPSTFNTPRLTIDSDAYTQLCGEDVARTHPCLHHYRGDLTDAIVEPYLEPLNITSEIIVKDDSMVDFTMRNASDAFIITYKSSGLTQLIYENYDAKDGCYNITLRGGKMEGWRIWVSDGKGKDRDIDTLHHEQTAKRLCSADLWIHVKDDGLA